MDFLDLGGKPKMPDWLDFKLSKEAVDRLWKYIEVAKEQESSANYDLVGQISKSVWLEDKDDWLFEHIIQACAETMFYKHWEHYYDVHVTKSAPPIKFVMGPAGLWVNYQKQYEFNPPHHHDGLFSFVIFMKIPTHWKEQHELNVHTATPCASDFQFLFGSKDQEGLIGEHNIPLSPEDEGRILFFPAQLKHQVFPFYGTEEERITISGNVFDVERRKMAIEGIENEIEYKEKELVRLKKKMKEYKRKEIMT